MLQPLKNMGFRAFLPALANSDAWSEFRSGRSGRFEGGRMRHFVGAACVAVIAAVAYFFWGEYQEHGARADREAARTWARNQLFHYAQAEPGDVEKVRGFCTSVAASEALKGDGNAELWLATCRLDGYL